MVVMHLLMHINLRNSKVEKKFNIFSIVHIRSSLVFVYPFIYSFTRQTVPHYLVVWYIYIYILDGVN